MIIYDNDINNNYYYNNDDDEDSDDDDNHNNKFKVTKSFIEYYWITLFTCELP